MNRDDYARARRHRPSEVRAKSASGSGTDLTGSERTGTIPAPRIAGIAIAEPSISLPGWPETAYRPSSRVRRLSSAERADKPPGEGLSEDGTTRLGAVGWVLRQPVVPARFIPACGRGGRRDGRRVGARH